jgi:hypothetical protein
MPDSFDDIDARFVDLRADTAELLRAQEQNRQEAVKRAADAVAEQVRVTDLLTTAQATAAALQQRVRELEAGGGSVALWTPQTVLEAGKTYALPNGQGVAITVRVPGVTFVGGHVWPTLGLGATCIAVLADDCTIRGTDFHLPDAPGGGKIDGIGPCVRTLAARTRLENTKSGDVNGLLECWVPDQERYPGIFTSGHEATVFGHVARKPMRGSLIFTSCDDSQVDLCQCPDSITENLCRWSPRDGVVGYRGMVARSKLGNPGNKSVIDMRRTVGGLVFANELFTSEGGTAVGVGRDDAGPGAHAISIRWNTIRGGKITIHQCDDGLVIEDNTFLWPQHGVNQAIYIGATPDLRLRRNRGPRPAGTVKPMVGYHKGILPVRLDDDGSSGWAAA